MQGVLVENVPFMHALHDVGSNDRMQIGLHEVKDQIDVLIVLCFEDIEKRDDIGMTVEFLQEDDLDEGK